MTSVLPVDCAEPSPKFQLYDTIPWSSVEAEASNEHFPCGQLDVKLAVGGVSVVVGGGGLVVVVSVVGGGVVAVVVSGAVPVIEE